MTYYCHDVTCEGLSGFDVGWVPATGPTYNSGGEPAYPVTDTCPYCGSEYFDERLEWENPMEALADELEQTGVLTGTDRADTDWQAVYAAIQKELNRQARERFNAKYEQHKRLQAEAASARSAADLAAREGIPF